MSRHTFLKYLALAVGGIMMPLHARKTELPRMPAFFVGHGSPMNALANNDFTRSLEELGEGLDTPKAILMISAHWMPPFYGVTVHKKPQLMYDFFGFPDELYKVEYPAPNAAFLTPKMEALFEPLRVVDRALDHGAWTVLKHLFPQADIPVMQLGINRDLSLREHFELGRRLGALREQGVMIMGSGNITHNLSIVNRDAKAKPESWALEFDRYIAKAIEERDFEALIGFEEHAPHAMTAHPTLEHYIPLLYVAGASSQKDASSFPYVGIEHGTLSMRNWLMR